MKTKKKMNLKNAYQADERCLYCTACMASPGVPDFEVAWAFYWL